MLHGDQDSSLCGPVPLRPALCFHCIEVVECLVQNFFLRNRLPDIPATPPGRQPLGARASRPHAMPLAAAELPCDAAASPHFSPGRCMHSEKRFIFSTLIGAVQGTCDYRLRWARPGEKCGPATLPVGTASARRKESHGAVPGGSKWGRGPRLRPAWCGRDARAPRMLSSDDAATPRALKCRSLLALFVDEGGPSVFRSVRVPSWLMSSSFDSFVDSRSVRPPKRILRTDRQRSPSNQWRQLKLLSCAGGLL